MSIEINALVAGTFSFAASVGNVHGDAILAETGDEMMTEDNNNLIIE